MFALAAWIGGQAVWLGFGFQLEFMGKSAFVPGLFGAAGLFFVVNCWILGVVVGDAGMSETKVAPRNGKGKVTEQKVVKGGDQVGQEQKSRVRKR